jgi:aminoglycoside phosphotransferase (APT) family kinase protein
MAVLDWELSTLGHPLSDLAYNCIQYYIPVTESRLSGYKGLNLSELGIPLETEYVDSYCRRTGRGRIADWEFFMAFSFFRLAGIVQGVYKRGLDGIASSEIARTYGEYVPFLAAVGRQIISK